MKLIRNGLVAVVAALTVLSATVAHAANTIEVDVTPANMNGWVIDPGVNSTTYQFVDNLKTLGVGSVQFGPIVADPIASKFIIGRQEVVGTKNLQEISFDYYIDPASSKVNDPLTPHRFYLNLYVDSTSVSGSPPNFYDCRYDFESIDPGVGWHRTKITPGTVAANVSDRANNTCGQSFSVPPAGSTVFLYVLNGGDTSADDAGLRGGFDNVLVSTINSAARYDFEPGPACSRDGAEVRNGTGSNNILRGTDGRDRIDARGGNDIVDGRGGADCLLGRDGNDQLTGGAGNDEIQAGPGNDIVNVKNDGVDAVDCGAGSDIVFADKNDTVSNNCETVQGRS